MGGAMKLDKKLFMRTSQEVEKKVQWIKNIKEVLTFRAGHDVLWPGRSTCLCMEKGHLSLVQGRKTFSNIGITKSQVYHVDNDSYPAPEFVASSARGEANDVTLVLPASWVITKSVELPAALTTNLAQAVEFEFDRLTPLAPDDALYDYTVVETNDDKVKLLLSVCRSDTVMPYKQALEREGIRVEGVTSATAAEDAFFRYGKSLSNLPAKEAGSIVSSLMPRYRNINLLARGIKPRTRVPLSLTIILLVILLASAIAYAFLPLSIEQKRIANIDQQIAAMKPSIRQVEQLKKEITAQEKEIAVIDGFRANRIRSIDLLREITKIMPKTAWLTRARFTDTSVDIEGYAQSASEIVPKLEASPLLRKVEFASPTFRDTRLNADRFVLKAEIENDKVTDGIKK
jgi:general secretion pathway protein L